MDISEEEFVRNAAELQKLKKVRAGVRAAFMNVYVDGSSHRSDIICKITSRDYYDLLAWDSSSPYNDMARVILHLIQYGERIHVDFFMRNFTETLIMNLYIATLVALENAGIKKHAISKTSALFERQFCDFDENISELYREIIGDIICSMKKND